MHTARCVYHFGPFALETAPRRLRDGQVRVALAARALDILLQLVAQSGRVLDRESLIRVGWPDTAVTDDSLRQVITVLRRTLGRQDDGREYIETRPRQGYVFTAPVVRTQDALSTTSTDALLDSFRVFVSGRAALESLNLDRVTQAHAAFGEALRVDPASADLHIGLACAAFLLFESTRVDPHPDGARLQQALARALDGCRLKPASGNAWGTLALVRRRQGECADALAAACKATALEPDDWMHYLRLAVVSWGQDRIRAARRALELNPDLALGHWLVATVFVARGQLDRALEELRAGCALQDAQHAPGAVAPPIGAFALHWLHGLVLAALGREVEARAELERELAHLDARHVYGRECAANCWYAIGALLLRGGGPDAAAAAFARALAFVPNHGMTSAAIESMARAARPPSRERLAEAAATGDRGPSTGWLLPVDPLLNVSADPERWAPALAVLRARAM